MKPRIDYWHDGKRYSLRLSGYGHELLAKQGGSSSAAITAALVAFLGNDDHMATCNAFCHLHDMSFSMLVEIALSRHLDR